jgi:hypothetical protein
MRWLLIGFKEAVADIGVGPRGEALVSPAVVAQMRAFVRAAGATVLNEFDGIPAVRVKLSPQAALVLRRHPMVDYVAPRTGVLTLDREPQPSGCTLPSQTIPWHITRVRADQAWALTRGDVSKVAVVLDDGIDEGAGGVPGPEIAWTSFRFYNTNFGTVGAHGTPVAGAINAADNSVGTVGVAPASRLHIDRVNSRPDTVYWDLAATAILDERSVADVMNMSFSTKITSASPPPELAGFYDAIKVAYYQNGVTFVASTGNQSASDLYAYPARFPEVIGVGGTNHSDQWVLNNYAPGNVDITAPAVDVYTVCVGGGTANGTAVSFSTPQVTGAVMLLKALHPTWMPYDVWERLRSSAVDVDAPGPDNKTGWGRLDVYAAVRPPVWVSWQGPGRIRPTETCTWVAVVTSGDPPFTYRWHRNGDEVGSDAQYTSWMLGQPSFTLNVQVWDANGTFGTYDNVVTADPTAPICRE